MSDHNEFMAIRRSRERRPSAMDIVDGVLFAFAGLATIWLAYLVFPRWAETGLGIVGHVETPVLWEAKGRDEVVALAAATPLLQVKQLLDDAIRRRAEELA